MKELNTHKNPPVSLQIANQNLSLKTCPLKAFTRVKGSTEPTGMTVP